MTESRSNEALSNLLHENRRFEPPADLAANANVKADAYDTAAADPEAFWAEQAKRISWAEEPTETLDWSKPPFARWFADGTLNAAYNCVDRHVENGRRRPGRVLLRGRAGRHPRDHLRRAQGRGVEGRERADRARREHR